MKFKSVMRLVVTLMGAAAAGAAQSPGSLFVTSGAMANMSRDLRAAGIGDLVTIVVSDQATAEASGGTDTTRKSTGNANAGSGFDNHLKAADATNFRRGRRNCFGREFEIHGIGFHASISRSRLSLLNRAHPPRMV